MQIEHEPYEDFPVLLPVDGSGDPALLRIGIEFGPFKDGDRVRGSRLPAGWTIESADKYNSYVVDIKKRRRAVLINIRDRLMIRPLRRFSHGCDQYDINSHIRIRFCVWDANIVGSQEEQVIFEKIFDLPDRRINAGAHEGRREIYLNEEHCQKWLNENFPKWNDCDAYWD